MSTVEADKRSELTAFVLLTVFLAPVVSIIVMGSYGLAIWISQLILGPPGL